MTLGELNRAAEAPVLDDWLSGRWPAESNTGGGTAYDPTPTLLRGLMPPLINLPQVSDWARWWQGYISTYLERDLRQVAQIEALLDFRRVMELLALRTGQLINQSEIARDARLSQPTVHRYLNLLETTHLFERLPAYAASRTVRLLKAPKVFWVDPALAVFLAGYYSAPDLRASREIGHFFGSLIYHHVRVAAHSMTPSARLSFWRTQAGGGAEVDFVVEQGRRALALEVKLTDTPGYRDTEGLRTFLSQHPRVRGGVLLHTSPTVRYFGDNLVALPWRLLTG